MSTPISSREKPVRGAYTKFRLRTDEDVGDDFPVPKTRRRIIRSCIACRKAKVRCDRQAPCDRCTAYGFPQKCTYIDASRPDWKPSSRPAIPERETQKEKEKDRPRAPNPNMYYYLSGDATIRTGLSHWASVINELEGVGDYLFDRKASFHDAHERLMQLQELYPARSSLNFPFGSPSIDLSSEALPAPAIVDSLVKSYMESWNVTHPLFSPACDHIELSQSQELKSSPASWSAQLNMVLFLGCKTASEGLIGRMGGKLRAAEFAERRLGLAEVYISRAQFLDFPDLAMIRTLCMVSLAKTMDAETPGTSRASVALIGLTVRLAMIMLLHRVPSTGPETSRPEREARRLVWNTLAFLDLSTAIDSGLPPVIRPTDWDTTSVPVLNEASVGAGAIGGDVASLPSVLFMDILTKSFPVVATVLSSVNSTQPSLEYSMVMSSDRELRAVLRQASQAFGRGQNKSDSLHQAMIEILLRRTLLALHRSFAQGTRSTDEAHRTSHWSVLECSLALLRIQHTLYDQRGTALPQVWFADLFQSDFAVAMLFVVQGLSRNDFSAEDPQIRSAEEHPVNTAYVALRKSLQILRADVRRSFHMFKLLLGVSLSVAALEASESGRSMDEAMQVAAESIVQAVEHPES